jgi:predicted CXXCH cytochrome family protein
MARETGKERQSRIDLYYYRQPDAQARWRGRLTLLALLVFGLWVALAPMPGRGLTSGLSLFQQASLASKGPLARPHATWEANCEACHIPFTPVNSSRWSPSPRAGSHAGDAACQTCHAGPAHHASQLSRDVPSCAECHRDHRGRDVSLLAMGDSVCTSCHGDLSRHRDPGAGPIHTAESVTRFGAEPTEHPGFKLPPGVPGPDSGRIKFSHARHMASGLTLEPKGKPFTFSSLKSTVDRLRYGYTDGRENDPIQLRCESCHRLDVAGSAGISQGTSGTAMPRSSGDSMLPVTYENDCRTCHPLAFDPGDPEREVPHGLKPGKVVDLLKQFYLAQAAKDDPALLRRFVPQQPIPGRPSNGGNVSVEEAVNDKTLVALKRLFGAAVEERVRKEQGIPQGRGGCVECHELTEASLPLVNLKAASSLDIKRVVVRSLWYESAVFNHTAHRALKCESCHESVSESKDQSRPLLPNIAQCVSCHAPATTESGRPRGGAGTSCVECHRYHNGDHPAQGVGAPARRGVAETTVDQFLSGGLRGGG